MSKTDIKWEQEALDRINQAPFFIRGVAKRKVEKVALRMGKDTVTLALVEQVKQENMKK
jgi:hypothetical protein